MIGRAFSPAGPCVSGSGCWRERWSVCFKINNGNTTTEPIGPAIRYSKMWYGRIMGRGNWVLCVSNLFLTHPPPFILPVSLHKMPALPSRRQTCPRSHTVWDGVPQVLPLWCRARPVSTHGNSYATPQTCPLSHMGWGATGVVPVLFRARPVSRPSGVTPFAPFVRCRARPAPVRCRALCVGISVRATVACSPAWAAFALRALPVRAR